MIELKSITEMTIAERREILTTVAEALEASSKEAWGEGHGAYAENSHNFAVAMKTSITELSTDAIDTANVLLQQAMMMILVFRQRHLYPTGAFLH